MKLTLNVQNLVRMSNLLGGAEKKDATWKMTPYAWSKCCMLPIDDGNYLGDVMYREKGQPLLLGKRVEIVQGSKKNDCRIALVEPESSVFEWRRFAN